MEVEFWLPFFSDSKVLEHTLAPLGFYDSSDRRTDSSPPAGSIFQTPLESSRSGGREGEGMGKTLLMHSSRNLFPMTSSPRTYIFSVCSAYWRTSVQRGMRTWWGEIHMKWQNVVIISSKQHLRDCRQIQVFLIISGGIEIYQFAPVRLILEAKFGNNP